MIYSINGRRSETISVLSRGLHYGDGLFETIAWRNGQLELWPEHMQRLKKGCATLGISEPDYARLLCDTQALLAGVNGNCVVKIIITRTTQGRGYGAASQQGSEVIIGLHDWPSDLSTHVTQGVHCITCETRLGHNPRLAGIKHLNRLEQVLAASELNASNAYEGIVLDIHDNVISGTRSNLFLIKSNTLYTPALQQCGIEGTVRAKILSTITGLELPAEIKTLDRQALHDADEVFLSNSIMRLVAVNSIDDKDYPDHSWIKIIQQLLS